ncbi:MAG: histidine--tRNA ligase [Myxococcota bacterium]
MSSDPTLRAVKGMNDILPAAQEAFLNTAVWDHIEQTANRILGSYGYRRIWLPVVEPTALFTRGIGEGSDIVAKQMYSFEDAKGRKLTLRPEGTAGAARAYVEHRFADRNPIQRWWYFAPYWAERPQKGRYRQFYQIGAEFFGVSSAAADAELIIMLWRWCQALGLNDIAIRINSLGDENSRQHYLGILRQYLHDNSTSLCDDCRARIEHNPLRALDCKRPGCKNLAAAAPDILESLGDAPRQHFDEVRHILTEQSIPHTRDPRLVRGLDYYTSTVFEFTTEALGAQDAILGGGRYDRLVQDLGGAPTPSLGFAAGIERLALLLANRPQIMDNRQGAHLYIIPMEGTLTQALSLADDIRAAGPWCVEVDVEGGRLKHQMRRADRSGAKCAMVLGEQEIAEGRGLLKSLDSSLQEPLELSGDKIAQALSQLNIPPSFTHVARSL